MSARLEVASFIQKKVLSKKAKKNHRGVLSIESYQYRGDGNVLPLLQCNGLPTDIIIVSVSNTLCMEIVP